MRRALSLGVVAVMSALLMGCSVRRSVSLSMKAEDYNGTVPPTRVHVVGVQEVELEKYENYPVDQWFKADDPLRLGSKVKELMFRPGQPDTQTIEKNDPLWETWVDRKCRYLVVFVNLSAQPQQPGVKDPRKQKIPLEDVESPVELRILLSGIPFKVPPKAKD